jgi:hypothetical protein
LSLKRRAHRKGHITDHEESVESDPRLRTSGVQPRAARSSRSQAPLPAAADSPMLSIGAPADPDLLDPTYAYVSAYVKACLAPQLADRLNVAVYELYSNALHHGSNAGEVRLELCTAGGGLRLTVTNHADPYQVERLRARVARVQDDPAAVFRDEMDRFHDASHPPPMIGLVRLAHQCGLAIELAVDGDSVRVSTICEG